MAWITIILKPQIKSLGLYFRNEWYFKLLQHVGEIYKSQ